MAETKGYTFKPISNGIFTIIECDHRYTIEFGKKRSGVKLIKHYGKEGECFYILCPVCGLRSANHRHAGDALAAFKARERIIVHEPT